MVREQANILSRFYIFKAVVDEQCFFRNQVVFAKNQLINKMAEYLQHRLVDDVVVSPPEEDLEISPELCKILKEQLMKPLTEYFKLPSNVRIRNIIEILASHTNDNTHVKFIHENLDEH